MTATERARRALLLAPVAVAACTLSLLSPSPPSGATPTPAQGSLPSMSPSHVASEATSSLSVSAPAPDAAHTEPTATLPFCLDERPRTLIERFKQSLLTSDGTLLAPLVSPDHGVDARLFRDGRVVNYDRQHAAVLFESTFQVDWGNAPGSGLAAVGSFRELLVPDLLDVFNRQYELSCDEIRVGGTTYAPAWPYTGINFYSIYFSGSPAVDNLDWHTWLLGMHEVAGDPYLYALMQFKWEP